MENHILLLIVPGTACKFLFKLLRSHFVADLKMPHSKRIFPFFMGSCINRFTVDHQILSNGIDFANSVIFRTFFCPLPRPIVYKQTLTPYLRGF